MRKTGRFGSCAIGIALLIGCGAPRNDPESLLRRGLSGEPATLDPAISGDNFSGQVLLDVFEGLAMESAEGTPVPAAAVSWETDSSGTSYTFHLRPGAMWSNGKPVLAENFVKAWIRVVDPKTGSPVADDLGLVLGARQIIAGKAPPGSLGVKAANDLTFVVQLERPAPYFPGIVTHSSTFPIYSENGTRGRDPASWVSNGAYVLERWEPGNQIKLRKNDRYWDAGKVKIKAIEYQFSSDENAQYSRYRAGQLDITDTVPISALASINSAARSELIVAPYLATAYYGLNLSLGPLARNDSFRKALSLAIDRHRITESLGFGQIPAYGFIPPNIWNYRQQTPDWSSWDRARRESEAKRLYAISGAAEKPAFRLRVLVNSNPAIKQTALQIAAMWKDVLGVESAIIEEEYRVFLESRHDKSRWDVARLAWVADFNDAGNFLDTLRGNSVNNDEGYSDSKYDSLIGAASETIDAARRRDLLEQAERLVLESTPIIPLYHYVSKRLVKPYVRGVAPSPLDRVPSKALSIVR